VSRAPGPPARSDRRRSWRDVSFAALDFETTGLDLRRDAVVSFGVVPVRQARVELAGACYREVSPAVPPSHRSVTIHHLRPVDLAQAPPLAGVAGELAASLEGKFLLTWSGQIEATFLARTFGGSPRRWLRRTVDVLPLAILTDLLESRDVPKGSSAYSLAEAVARRGLPVEEAHDALNDALMTAEMFLVLAARLAAFGLDDVRSFLRAARRPPDRVAARLSRRRRTRS
jgi:DNA polymerase III subunit epsilon